MPGVCPGDGACAPSRPLNLSGLTRVSWREEFGHCRLDQARVTEYPQFCNFAGLRGYVLGPLRYPTQQSNKFETYSWSPTLYSPTINVARRHTEPACWRCAEAEANALSCWVADIDNKDDGRPFVSEAQVAAEMASLMPGQQPVEHFTYTSFSSSTERRKFRLICETDRDLTRAEQRDTFILLNERVLGAQGDGSIYDPGDHLYGPPHHTEITVVRGVPLPIDLLLAEARQLRAERPELWSPFAKKESRATRAATPEELVEMRARMANQSAPLNFGGIADPFVFNPDWHDEYPTLAVQGTHYHTMLSLLGRVWRKTGGRLSYGEMRTVFNEIDLLDGGHIALNYPSDKPAEMLRFVMSQPVIDDVRPNTDALEWRMRRLRDKSRGGRS
jgi:hypothetical protein